MSMEPPCRLVIVQRDRPDVLRAILQGREAWPGGTGIMFDRRRAERRAQRLEVRTERRVRQRRAALDPTWQVYGFIVREVARLPVESAVLRGRGSGPEFGTRPPPSIHGGRDVPAPLLT
jgi:hypothetical protein